MKNGYFRSTAYYARVFNWRGIELGKVFKFSNSREGFENFKDWMRWLQDREKNIESRSQILVHQSTDSVKEHHDAPLWISRTKELGTLQKR